jgi:hypothetical protein
VIREKLAQLRQYLTNLSDARRLAVDLNKQTLENYRLNRQIENFKATQRVMSVSYDELAREYAQLKDESFRAEQVLTAIKAFARNTPYRQAARVLLTMLDGR